MAESVVYLKVDSQDYENKIKRASEGLQHYAEVCKKAGGTLEYVDEEAMAFARDLGKMDTVATNAKARMREYTDAITTATAMYRKMSDAEKQGDFGKALSASIAELKIKAADLKDVMADTNMEIKNLASDTNFTEGISLMTRTIGASAAAITAWTGESKEMEAVIKDLAKIGTTVAAIDQLTKAFQKQNLVLLKNPYVLAAAGVAALAVAMGTLIKKSQELSAMEKDLQDVQKKGREDSAKEVTRIQSLNTILHDNTRSLDERKAALAEIQALVPEYHGALTTEGTLINDNTDALSSYIANLQRAATAQAAFDRMVELQKQKLQQQLDLQEKQRNLASAQARNQSAQGQVVYAGTEMTQVYTQQGVNQAESAVRQAEADIRATEVEIQALQNLISVSTLATSTGRVVKPYGRGSAKGGTKTSKSADVLPVYGSLGDWEAQAAAVQQYMKGATSTEEYKELEADLEFILEKIKEIKGETEVVFAPGSLNDLNQQLREAQDILANLAPDTEEWAAALQDVADKTTAVTSLQAKMGVVPSAKSQTKDANEMRGAFSAAASAVSTVGAALQTIDDPAAKIAGIVATAIANIALGFAQATASPATTVAGVFGWIAAATTGLATMVSTITAIKSVTAGSYASGGIIPGNSYSGDNLTANVNSGELILNRAQQSNIASQLEGAGQQGGGASTPYVSGENIVLGVNNYFGRSGQGEIVTTSMLRRAGINI